MHAEVMEFVKTCKAKMPAMFTEQVVHEIGSLNINGTVRDMFERCDYTGFDLMEGVGVDIAKSYSLVAVNELHRPTVIISTEALEHDDRWQDTLRAIKNNLRVGGVLILTCATNDRLKHGTIDTDAGSSPATPNYYRNILVSDLVKGLDVDKHFSHVVLKMHKERGDLYFFGIKTEE
jgi:hypothetical protein